MWVGDMGTIPGSGKSPGGGNDNSLQDSCLENSTDRGTCQAMVFGVIKRHSDRTEPLTLLKLKIDYAAAKSLQSCPTLCDPIDGSPSGSPVPGILQARTLEWVAISFSNA